MLKFVVSFKLLDPDPEEPIIYGTDPTGSGSGSATLIVTVLGSVATTFSDSFDRNEGKITFF